mmetsp:Transcript_52562/g.97317  ORF Transcript_52562/g.97317 Transcript_52562/m.97317 type:complete len:274 (+) Transcript_52562:138-959(+)
MSRCRQDMNSLGVQEEDDEVDAIGQSEMAACGIEELEAEAASDTEETAAITGLLHLLTTEDESLEEDWLPYFVVLKQHTLLWYADAALTDLRGSATLLPSSVVHTFEDESSPWHDHALCGDRPGGFVVDVDSRLEAEEKVLLYFDALQSEQTVLWLVALQNAVGDASAAEALQQSKAEAGTHMATVPEVEVVEIDDFSDYEENSHAAVHERSSSFSHRYSADWGTEAEVAGGGDVPNYEIDDFSDYEDDENARRSSIVNLSQADWSKINQVTS